MTLPWAMCLCVALLGVAEGQHGRPLSSLAASETLDQILAGDGQPEDIGYGYQRVRNTASARNMRNTRTEPAPSAGSAGMFSEAPAAPGLLLLDRSALQEGPGTGNGEGQQHVTSSAFRERMASRQRRQRSQLQQQQQPQPQWGDWRRDSPGISSFYPPISSSEPVDNPERYLQALREAWARYQQQTGAIDVGPDDLTDLETLQFLESLGEDIPGTRKRSSPTSGAARQYASGAASPFDWAAPLAWSGYQLRKRSANPEYQEESGEWADDGEDGEDSGPGLSGPRLAALLSQQLFDERYDDPAVKRLLLAKRSTQNQQQPQQASKEASDGLQGRAMRRRKKSTRAALAAAQQQDMQTDGTTVHEDLARIFGESDPDGEPEPPRALPLAAGPEEAGSTGTPEAVTTATATATATAVNAANASTPSVPVVGLNPIGHAHETDKIAREHHAHASSTTATPNVLVHLHGAEHAPPMVSAEGPHGHDHAVRAEDKKPTEKPQEMPEVPGLMGAEETDHLNLELRPPRRLAKKSIDWSQYFGIDRRRKKSLSLNDVDAPARIDPDWLMQKNLMAFRFHNKPSNINKRGAMKREGASPDALLLGAWGHDAEDDDDDQEQDIVTGHCPAVSRLAESCRRIVGSNDGLLPLCVLYQACHLCSAAMRIPVGASCEAELARRGAHMCSAPSSSAGREECRSGVEAILRANRSRQPDTETCAKQPCLAHFFISAPAVAFAR